MFVDIFRSNRYRSSALYSLLQDISFYKGEFKEECLYIWWWRGVCVVYHGVVFVFSFFYWCVPDLDLITAQTHLTNVYSVTCAYKSFLPRSIIYTFKFHNLFVDPICSSRYYLSFTNKLTTAESDSKTYESCFRTDSKT